ncbi:MAG: PQQ-binding-like beta-propeller repeat protein [Pseudomonadota bacterium]
MRTSAPDQRAPRVRRSRPAFAVASTLTTAVLLAGCGGGLNLPSVASLNPFAAEEERHPGKREAVLTRDDGLTGTLSDAQTEITLPEPVANASWSQPGGTPSNALGHLALSSAPRRIWSASAGEGSTSSGRLIASPIVVGGRVFTLDTEGLVSAFSLQSGTQAWRTSLTPENEDEAEGFGGGLAASGGLVYASTGFGTVAALNASNGTLAWTRRIGIPLRASPTATERGVFVVASDGRLFALSAADGSPLWTTPGLPQSGGLLTNASPAVTGNTVIAPFPSGEIVAYDISSGNALWTDSLARSRLVSAFSSKSDASRPAVGGKIVVASSHAGRVIASDVSTGARLWSQNMGGVQMPWIAGNLVFLVDTTGKLLALDNTSGGLVWAAQLPGGGTWSGPVLAGGKLWLGSTAGRLVSADAKTGKVTSDVNIGERIAIAPVVAANHLLVLTNDADLIAFR